MRAFRRGLRDLPAVSALGALWLGQARDDILLGLVDAMLSALRADLVYVRVATGEDEAAREIVRTPDWLDRAERARDVGSALTAWLESGECASASSFQSPVDGALVRLGAAVIRYEGGQGVLVAGSCRADYPAPTDRLILALGANQAASALRYAEVEGQRDRALEAAREALDRERRHSTQLRSLADASRLVNGTLSLDAMLRAVAERARAIVGARLAICSYVVAHDWEQAVHAESRAGRPPRSMREGSRGKASELEALVVRENRPCRLSRAELTARAGGARRRDGSIRRAAPRGWLAAPLAGRDGRNLGLLQLSDKRGGDFTEEDEAIVVQLALMAAIAAENAQFHVEAQERAALEERRRLSRELHDSVSQALYGIVLSASIGRAVRAADSGRLEGLLGEIVGLAEAGLAEMRALIFELRPESLAEEGLVAALEKQAAALQARRGIAVRAALVAEPDAPLAVKEALYRIAQEALHNTVKHARARAVDLALEASPGELVLRVSDDGRGFDPGGDFPGHLGLRSMRERAAALGGALELESAPGRGTRLRARIPLAAPA
jgi:signal transduction histidine kinase